MARKCYNPTDYTLSREETQNTTATRQQEHKVSLPRRDDYKTRKDRKYCINYSVLNGRVDWENRLVPHVDKAPLPLRILRLVTSNFLPVENPTHPTAHAPERASVYILGQFRTSK